MIINATKKIMTDAEAIKIARGGGNIFGKAMFGKSDINLRILYLESREVILNLYYRPAPLMKLLGKTDRTRPEMQKIRMMVEGTRCTASYMDSAIQTFPLEVEEKDIQKTEYSDEKIVQTAKRPALRMVRRQIGRIAEAELASMKSIYRPFYIAFYGEVEMGKKVRYLPIAADGHSVERTI